MSVGPLRLQLLVSALVFLYVGASVLLDPEGQSRASFNANERKVHLFTLLEAILARIIGAYCFGLGLIMQSLAILVHDRTALLVANYALIPFYAMLAYVWYYWIGVTLKGALLWDVETCNFNAGGYAFFAVFTVSCIIASHFSSRGTHHHHNKHRPEQKKD